jgi:molybdate transport system substrate-binding protein
VSGPFERAYRRSAGRLSGTVARMASLLAVSLLLGVLAYPVEAYPAADKKPILVFATTDAADIVDRIGKAFTKSSGTPVVVTAGASPALTRQILQGAPADLFVPTGAANLVLPQRAGLLDEQSTYVWMRNSLVVIAPSHSAVALTSAQEIADPRFHHLALADPGRVPVGILARQSLNYTELWDAVRERVVPVPDAGSVLTSVGSGEADLGIVFASEARTTSRVKIVFALPDESHGPIQYFVSRVAHSGASADAQGFMSFLKTDEARRLLIEAGFTPAFP